jgi:hypothetical protein
VSAAPAHDGGHGGGLRATAVVLAMVADAAQADVATYAVGQERGWFGEHRALLLAGRRQTILGTPERYMDR